MAHVAPGDVVGGEVGFEGDGVGEGVERVGERRLEAGARLVDGGVDEGVDGEPAVEGEGEDFGPEDGVGGVGDLGSLCACACARGGARRRRGGARG